MVCQYHICQWTSCPTSNTSTQFHPRPPQLGRPPTAAVGLPTWHLPRPEVDSLVKNNKKPAGQMRMMSFSMLSSAYQIAYSDGRCQRINSANISLIVGEKFKRCIGNTILHPLAGDFGLPNLSAGAEGYDNLQRLFYIGPDDLGPSVKCHCLSMIDCQNDGYCVTDGALAVGTTAKPSSC
ncbi:hypothetical protein CORC01_14482 [Colletotrichum orchidophilum]|uniref:Uncharacterized protein n=1 Tax=Colletotrichum orchidophilum TaxID=1209926 RepID=A0A1G4AMF2_9PEZI|nr:uncharacterized protein CORC01_14482 [Colletotrichum orchidophilum]OHE90223.1 hypothetical protein CORC01_14482 [Colletotrichum orchidophilum]